MHQDVRFPPKEAAQYLTERGRPVEPSTLAWWRSQGKGPKFFKVMGRISYSQSHLDELIAAGETDPTTR